MKKINKIVSSLLIVTLLFGSLFLTACGKKEEENGDLQVIRLGVMTGNVDYFAAYYEEITGFYKKHGIKLEVYEFPKGVHTVDALVNGTVDIGQLSDYATINRIGNSSSNTDLVIFSQLFDGTAKKGGLYVDPAYADDLSKLDGSKGFIVNTGAVSEYYTNLVIAQLGLDVSKQNLIGTENDQTSLALAARGDATAMFTIESASNHLEELGWVLAKPAEEFGISIGSFWLTKQEFAKNTDLLGEFLLASQETFDYISEHTEEVATYFENKTGISQKDFFTVWNGRNHKVGFSEEAATHLESIQNWAVNHGRYDKAFNVRDFIDTTAAEKAMPDKVTIKK